MNDIATARMNLPRWVRSTDPRISERVWVAGCYRAEFWTWREAARYLRENWAASVPLMVAEMRACESDKYPEGAVDIAEQVTDLIGMGAPCGGLDADSVLRECRAVRDRWAD